MKFLKFFSMRYLILGAVLFGAGAIFFWPQIQANIFGDIAGKVGGKKAKKAVDKGTDKAIKETKKGVEKGVKEVGKVSEKALKELSKLGFPTDPQKLIAFALSKLPAKELEKLATKILNIVLDQVSDLSKISKTVMRPIDEITRPIPPIPLFGIPIPGLPAAVSSIIDILCDFTLASCIRRTQYDTFAYLKAFHTLTHNKYINADEKKLIKSKEDFDKKKGVIGKTVDLNKLRGISGKVSQEIKKIAGPLEELIKFVELQAAPLTKPFEQLAKEFRPIPLASFIPIAGPIYNRVIFVFNLKDMNRRFEDKQAIMENGLKPVTKSKPLLGALTSITDLEKNPITSNCMKILRTLKAPGDKALEKVDEMFVDPLSKLPWGSQGLLTLTLTVLNLMGGGIDGIIKEVVEVIAGAVTGGAAVAVTGIITKVINVKMINEFITETFYWSYIRYLQKRITRIDELIKKAQGDGVTFDGNAFKQEVQKVLEFQEDYQKNDSSKKSKDKKDNQKEIPTVAAAGIAKPSAAQQAYLQPSTSQAGVTPSQPTEQSDDFASEEPSFDEGIDGEFDEDFESEFGF